MKEVTGCSAGSIAVGYAGRPSGESWFLSPEIDFKRKLSLLIPGWKLDRVLKALGTQRTATLGAFRDVQGSMSYQLQGWVEDVISRQIEIRDLHPCLRSCLASLFWASTQPPSCLFPLLSHSLICPGVSLLSVISHDTFWDKSNSLWRVGMSLLLCTEPCVIIWS